MHSIIIIIVLSLLSCSEEISKPSFIQFKTEKDSLYVISKNHLPSPLYIKAIDRESNEEVFKQLKANEESVILSYSNKKIDTNWVLKKFKFSGYYGIYPFKSYDTSHVYTFPFLKGYSSKIIQGYDGDFSHQGDFSANTIDFKMKVGDTITAARDGIVVKVSQDNYKQGRTEKYKDFANFIMLYHKDNTFSQYVHLKQYGSLVKVGDSIKSNQPIALSGFTGWTTIPHLHFGVYRPSKNGLVSIPVNLDSINGKTLKRGQTIIKK